MDTLTHTTASGSGIDLVSWISLILSVCALVLSIWVEFRNRKISSLIGRPFVRVNYRLNNQFLPENPVKRFHITAFVKNESGFRIKINSIHLDTNGNVLNGLHIPLVNPWLENNEERDYSWVIEFLPNINMQNTIKLSVENELSQKYSSAFDFSAINEGTAFHDKLDVD